MIKIECPFCKQPIEFSEEMIGQWTDCPACREQIPLEKTEQLTDSKASLAGLYQGVRNRNAIESSKKELSKEVRGMVQAGYVLAFLLPIVGFFFGLFLMFKNAVAEGVACMILSLLFSYLWFELIFAIF
jgi:hypothetical protein